MARKSGLKNMRNLIEMFESRANNADDEDASEIANAAREAFNIALGMKY